MTLRALRAEQQAKPPVSAPLAASAPQGCEFVKSLPPRA